MADVIELSFDDLGLTKPLEKMTTKELRELAIAKIPSITGASALGKDEIVKEIKDIFGIAEEGGVSPYKEKILAVKRQIRELRIAKDAMTDRKERDKARRTINRLKKQTRALAKA
ncbi:MAG: hypothetical protein ACNI27_03345 [Desulfovibrio sp.]